MATGQPFSTDSQPTYKTNEELCTRAIWDNSPKYDCWKLTSLMRRACSMTSVRPLSCKEESRDGSWNTNTVTTSVATNRKDKRQEQRLILLHNNNNSGSEIIQFKRWYSLLLTWTRNRITAQSSKYLKDFSKTVMWTHLKGTVKGHNILHYWWCAWVR